LRESRWENRKGDRRRDCVKTSREKTDGRREVERGREIEKKLLERS
jgi:hypothetical protein